MEVVGDMLGSKQGEVGSDSGEGEVGLEDESVGGRNLGGMPMVFVRLSRYEPQLSVEGASVPHGRSRDSDCRLEASFLFSVWTGAKPYNVG